MGTSSADGPRGNGEGRHRTWSAARWAISRGAVRPEHLASYARMAAIKARYPDVTFLGPCFLREDVTIEVRRGYGRIIIGPWVHVGAGTSLRCHEGTLRVGAKTVFGRRCTVNTWLDVEIGDACLFGDDVYLCDFDHVTTRLDIPIKDQGIVKTPVRIGDDVWLGTKVAVTRGTRIGSGSVVGAASVVRGDFPPHAVIVGAPARVVRSRDPEVERVRRAAGVDLPRLRDAVRAVIADEHGRVLLMHFRAAEDVEFPAGVWACPGAEVSIDDDPGVILLDEIEKASGLHVDGVGDPVWVRETLQPDEEYDGTRDTYHLLEVTGVDADLVDLDVGALRLEGYVEAVRWWHLDEIAEAQRRHDNDPAAEAVVFSPGRLAHVLGDLLMQGRPATPWRHRDEGERPTPTRVRRR
ncbi:2,3,4,5-tetrahydropyridine-2,6-dicarboxylate N-acetyltransferase [Austwickia sp. TVS 96-490-7B]|uniref:DapH/DapD/GlmU-related protein n=1 Tax=Austwickia sp. TVS 96-490-7B TaxID=2830843 RepID=UPI001D95D78D|nr:DapH/DapD/GlmU-related protein [Austwickia sp. TVS 96-490-7B]MBW3084521.1 2,3,4,5-tetrahydropyridine-2,6-dicarboxylate N-acetyltransferase [Austwickia sp. TVS 96-490-7B]